MCMCMYMYLYMYMYMYVYVYVYINNIYTYIFLYLISRVFIQFQCCDMFRWVFPFLILDLVENLFKFQIFQRLRRNAPRRRTGHGDPPVDVFTAGVLVCCVLRLDTFSRKAHLFYQVQSKAWCSWCLSNVFDRRFPHIVGGSTR